MGRVVGTVVSTRKEDRLSGLRFLVIKPLSLDLKESEKIVVAADAVGAGVGEVVLFASGSSARQTEATTEKPIDATVMAIVDSFDVMGRKQYDKNEEDRSGRFDPAR